MSTKNNRRVVKIEKNAFDWQPTDKDYVLCFLDVQGEWRECSHNLPQFSSMLLADYLNYMHINVPDYTQFLRVIDDERGLCFEYKVYGGRISIYVTYRD